MNQMLSVGDVAEFDIGGDSLIGLVIGFDAKDVLLMQVSGRIRRRNLKHDTEKNKIDYLYHYDARIDPVDAWDKWLCEKS